MDHLQVAVLALRETIDRQCERIKDLELQRVVLIALLIVLLLLWGVRCVI